MWERMFMEEILQPQTDPTVIFCDSSSAIQLIANPTFHDRSKHIQGRMHYVRERALDGDVAFQKVHTKENVADMLTKGVPAEKLTYCRRGMGLA
jgi:hypothetical protein